MALFHGILSYDGKLTITAMSDREVMPDPEFYRQCMQEAFDELKAATVSKPKRAGKRKQRKPASN